MNEPLKAPFPYYGGKSKIASIVWSRFGNVPNFVEPFFGSGAVLLSRPHKPGIETVNDISSLICNFWRAVKCNPDQVAHYTDWPAIENDLHSRHYWLVQQKESLQSKLEGDPEYYDAKIAGWWCWGMSLWIGHGFCSGDGAWSVVDGKLVKRESSVDSGVTRQLIHLGNAGRGVHRKRIHLLHHGQGIMSQDGSTNIKAWMQQLARRLSRVRVTCGDWKRVCGPTVTYHNGLTGFFCDPPYGDNATREQVYEVDSFTVADECRKWCIDNGNNPLIRIALCGYQGEHEELSRYEWTQYTWKTNGGYGNQGDGQGRKNAKREIIWFSPHCLKDNQMALFGESQ